MCLCIWQTCTQNNGKIDICCVHVKILPKTTTKMDVKSKQTEVALDMMKPSTDWKFLIYDSIGQDILAPLFTIKELRNHGVTLHLLIDSDRDPVPDVAAVYFVMPTDDNIERICKDLMNHSYESYYFNFISAISRTKLETIANAALLSDSAINVKRVFDQYLNFISLEEDLFILREHDKSTMSYYDINRTDATDVEITNVIDNIVDCLFSLLVTMNAIPIIRCSRGGPSECVAEKLSRRISETLRDNKSSLFNSKKSSNKSSGSLSLALNRPLLVLVDRNFDMSTPLHHTWTYQAMIHDLMNTRLNQVKIIETDAKTSRTKSRTFDLNCGDKFWTDQKGGPFPQVADAVQRELDEYRKNEDEVKRLKTTMGLDGPSDEVHLSESTAKLTNAVSSLPELLENKRVIEMHTTIATSVLDEIKSRKLDNFFETEEKIMNRSLIDKASLNEMIADPSYGKPEDKYRLFLISYICDNPSMSDDDAEKNISILENFGCKRSAYDYIQKWKTFSKINVATLQSSLQSSGGVPRTTSMFSKLMSQGSQFVMEGVKNLVLKEHFLPLTKIVDGLMDSNSKVSSESIEYLYFDPKALKENETPRKKNFQDAIVFVVGGGSYVEYQNLVDYTKSKSKSLSGAHSSKQIVYGSTDLMNASQFLAQLEKLGAN